MRIVIDPGHGGKDPGAVGPSGLKEAVVNLAVALRLAEKLEKVGVSVKLTRSSDTFVDLKLRTDIANAWKADYFISIHCNAVDDPKAHGTETYCYKYGGQGEILAKAIQIELVAATGRENRGIDTASFYVLRKTNMPAVLVELAFISNPEENHLLGNPDYREKCAEAILRGIAKAVGIPIKQEGPKMSSVFKDVPPTYWAVKSIERLADPKLNIIKGDAQGNFRPDALVTRAEVAVMLDRLLRYLGKED